MTRFQISKAKRYIKHTAVVGILSIILFGGGFYTGYSTHKPSAVLIPQGTPIVTPHDDHPEFNRDNMLIRVNEARLAHGLNQLFDDRYLATQAQKDLVNNCPVTNHTNFGSLFNKGIFKDYSQVAETLNSGEMTPQAAIQAFLDSPTHADILIGQSWDWKYVGIGIVNVPYNCVSLIFGK